MKDCGNIKCIDYDAEYVGACSSLHGYGVDMCPNYKPYQQTSTVSELLTKIDQQREAAAKEEKAKFEPYWVKVQQEEPMEPLAREDWDKKVDKLEIEKPKHTQLGLCLDEAKACITGERQDQYGNPEDSFALIARYWNAYITKGSRVLNGPLTALDVAHMMILFKVARCQGQAPKRDNYTDICGYSSIAADRIMGAKS